MRCTERAEVRVLKNLSDKEVWACRGYQTKKRLTDWQASLSFILYLQNITYNPLSLPY